MIQDNEELKKKVQTSMEDLRKLIDLNKKFSKGRDVIDEIAKAKKGGDEGLLGK